jgi:hypothetical protein
MSDVDLVRELGRTFRAAIDHDEPVRARHELLAAGWLDALQADEPVAVAVVFTIQGSTRRDAATLDDVIARRLARFWPDAGCDLAVAYPAPMPSDGRTVLTHAVLPGQRHARRLLWLDDLSGKDLEILELEEDLEGITGYGVDPDFGLLGLSGPPSGRSTPYTGTDARSVWCEALAAGRVALAYQMIAGAQAMLGLAVAYAQTRKQFGRPIGTYQAIKHRLAETLVAVSAASAAATAAASTQTTTGAATAKVLAGRAAATAAKNCLQVFGGVGFTVEHEFHRYFRRNLVLERLLGDRRTIERQLGADCRARRLPGDRIVDLTDPLRMDVLEAMRLNALTT